MNVLCNNNQTALDISSQNVINLSKAILKKLNIDCDEVSIHLVDKKTITQLHLDYFDDPSSTDCISFPIDSPKKADQGYRILGEIFVCPEVAIEYSKQYNYDPYKELSLYIVHGLLHLIGYNDIEEGECILMREQEKQSLANLEKEDLLLYAPI